MEKNIQILKHTTQKKLIIALFFTIFIIFTAPSASAECVYDGVNFHIKDAPENIISPIHRLYNTQTGVHLYTKGVADANAVLTRWSDFEFTDGIPAFCASLTNDGTTPIYRLYNTKTGVHLYTRGEADRNAVMSKWPEFEFTDGIPSFYASLTSQAGLTPIYRLYNTKTGVHLYTRGEADRNAVMSKWPEFEFTDGVAAFYTHITYDAGPELLNYQGPNITVGLYAYTESELRDNSFRITANENYVVKNNAGAVIATIPANTQTRVKYLDDSAHTFNIYNSIPDAITAEEVYFQAADSTSNSIIFTMDRPEMSFSQYRGKIKLKYSNNDSTKRIWIINELPLEHYTWGMGEITGTGPSEYNKMMTTVYRSYGYWKILYSTAYAIEGFKVNATSGNQIYYGYEWETSHPRIKEGAVATQGKVVKHGSDIALTPYSSWTDGNTRSFEERWGSTLYPWCQSVSDPYGDYNGDYWDNAYKSTEELVAGGNHMVGISAHGALTLANDKGWDWQRIIKYYLSGVDIADVY